MLNTAQLRSSAESDAATDEQLNLVDLVYVRPLGAFPHFEVRLRDVVGTFSGGVRFTRVAAGDLVRFTSERVFLSKTVPNVVVIRGGEVIAQAAGDLPARELERIDDRAMRR
jgi:hypothetical protein